MNSHYLGDGVYARIENGMVKLVTTNGIEHTNTIYLGLSVYQALQEFVEAAISDVQ